MKSELIYPVDESTSCYFILAHSESLVLLQALIESREGLAILRTLSPENGLLALVFCNEQQKEAEELLLALEPCWQNRMLSVAEAQAILEEQGCSLTIPFILGEQE